MAQVEALLNRSLEPQSAGVRRADLQDSFAAIQEQHQVSAAQLAAGLSSAPDTQAAPTGHDCRCSVPPRHNHSHVLIACSCCPQKVPHPTRQGMSRTLHILIWLDHAVRFDRDADGTAAAHASLVYTRCAKDDEPASSPANRKVRILRARTLGADDNDKYSARHRGNNPFDMLAIYFGLVFSCLHVALGSARRAPPRQGALSVTGPFSVSPPSLFLCLKPLPRPPPPPNTHTHTHQDPGASSRLPLPLGSQRAGQRPVKAEKLLLLIVLMSLGVAGLMLYLSSTRRLAVQHGASAGARGWGAEGGGAGVA